MSRNKTILGLTVILAAVFLFAYGNQLIYGYAVPPGGDGFAHQRFAQAFVAGDFSHLFSYHNLWHLISFLVAKATGLLPVTVMAWLGPGLLVTMAISLFIFNWRFFGWYAGVMAALIITFLSRQPLQTLWDGGFPNVLAAGTVLPIALIVVDWAVTARARVRLVAWPLVLVVIALLFFSHHIVGLYGGLIIVIYLAVSLIVAGYKHRLSLGLLLTLVVPILTFILTVLGLWAVLKGYVSVSAQGLASDFLAVDATWPFIHVAGTLDSAGALVRAGELTALIGLAPVWLAVGGAGMGLIYLISDKTDQRRRGVIILLVWMTVLYLASQQAGLGFPVRLSRDLAVPLALASGILVQGLADFVTARSLPKVLVWVAAALCLGLGWQTFNERLDQVVSPNSLVYHLPVDSQAADKINQVVPAGSRILVFQNDIYLSAFVRQREIVLSIDLFAGNKLDELASPERMAELVPSVQYVYVERRYNKDTGALNHDGIVASYQESLQMKQVFSFEQAEKSVYLFRVVR